MKETLSFLFTQFSSLVNYIDKVETIKFPIQRTYSYPSLSIWKKKLLHLSYYNQANRVEGLIPCSIGAFCNIPENLFLWEWLVFKAIGFKKNSAV